uniref:Uncharacterized protein n=3 Tax=Nothobranchius TaxID=28779 RepID=A0A1A8B4M8_NOTFU
MVVSGRGDSLNSSDPASASSCFRLGESGSSNERLDPEPCLSSHWTDPRSGCQPMWRGLGTSTYLNSSGKNPHAARREGPEVQYESGPADKNPSSIQELVSVAAAQ